MQKEIIAVLNKMPKKQLDSSADDNLTIIPIDEFINARVKL
jgi:hypothetical protein